MRQLGHRLHLFYEGVYVRVTASLRSACICGYF
jgi:hypothetical protein